MKLIDMHCHILPGIDDGAKNKLETIEMLKLMKEEGVVAIIATPHYRPGMFTPDMKEIQRRFQWTRKAAYEEGIYLWLGCECYAHEQMLEKLDEKKYNRMGKSRYLLVEFSSLHSYNIVRQYIGIIVSAGYIPIIAHVERIPALGEHIDYIWDLKELGAKIQVNAESILGESGWKVKRSMRKLMNEDAIDYIASDSHGAKKRVPNLGKCYRYVEKKMGKEYAKQVFYENPKKIIIHNIGRIYE